MRAGTRASGDAGQTDEGPEGAELGHESTQVVLCHGGKKKAQGENGEVIVRQHQEHCQSVKSFIFY